MQQLRKDYADCYKDLWRYALNMEKKVSELRKLAAGKNFGKKLQSIHKPELAMALIQPAPNPSLIPRIKEGYGDLVTVAELLGSSILDRCPSAILVTFYRPFLLFLF